MKRHALFVGVNTYDDPSIRPLRFSIPDASVLADRFEALGFESRHLPDPTAAQLKSAVEKSVEGLGPGDVFLFFFSGHGFTDQGGAHLLFCRDDRQKLLRVGGAGTRVDALEMLAEGPFHRAFLLDSCRSDALSGVENKGSYATRDIDLVAIPKSRGSTFILRSCDKFLPSLEVESLGHGLFTRGLLDAIVARDPGLARCGTDFADSVRTHMAKRAAEIRAGFDQSPCSKLDGPPFSLFSEGFAMATTHGVVSPTSHSAMADAQTFVECPVCFANVSKAGTHNCKRCGRQNVCGNCWDAARKCCSDCAAEAKAVEEARRRAAEETRIAKENADAAECERIAKAKAAEEARIAKELAEAERAAAEKSAREAEERNRPAGTRKVMHIGEMEVAFRWCPPGTFMMGSPESGRGRYEDETQHRVTLTKGFWMGETQVTQELWKAVMGNNPSFYEYGDDYPVETVSWNDCQKFLKVLNSRFPVDGYHFALPTEAQWEYACRAGTTGAYGGNGCLVDMGWYDGNSYRETHPVAQKKPNAWGLYDMHGNVSEWCADRYGAYPCGAVADPAGHACGGLRVLRGGSFWYSAQRCRSATRDGDGPDSHNRRYGFRFLALQNAP